MSISDERLEILAKFGDSDVQDLVSEVKLLRKIIRDFYGTNINLESFED